MKMITHIKWNINLDLFHKHKNGYFVACFDKVYGWNLV